jgi:hypothetical protein
MGYACCDLGSLQCDELRSEWLALAVALAVPTWGNQALAAMHHPPGTKRLVRWFAPVRFLQGVDPSLNRSHRSSQHLIPQVLVGEGSQLGVGHLRQLLGSWAVALRQR